MGKRQAYSWVEKEASRNHIPINARGGESASIIGTVLVALFFYAHKLWDTGFFTSGFGSFEAALLYGSIILGSVGPVTRICTGSRNTARVQEIVVAMFWIFSSVIFLESFPFDFTHFGDVLPDFARFLVGWLTNEIAWIFVLIGTIGGIAFVGVAAFLFVRVRSLLRLHPDQ